MCVHAYVRACDRASEHACVSLSCVVGWFCTIIVYAH